MHIAIIDIKGYDDRVMMRVLNSLNINPSEGDNFSKVLSLAPSISPSSPLVMVLTSSQASRSDGSSTLGGGAPSKSYGRCGVGHHAFLSSLGETCQIGHGE